MQPELVKEFIAEYHRELNRLNANREGDHAQQTSELARVDRQIRAVIEAIKDGMRTSGMKDELLAL
jgi:site-specific DNA recombinase